MRTQSHRAVRLKTACWSAIATLVSIAVLASAFRRLIPVLATAIAPTGGDPFFSLFVLEWGASRWPKALSGFWDAPFFYPSQLVTALSDHLLLPSAIHFLFRKLGATPALSYNLLFLLAFALTAVACFALVRQATRCPPWAAAILALAVAFAPWRWGQLTHFQMLWAPGPPLALLTLDRLLRRPTPRRAVAFALAYLLTIGSGSYLAYFTHLAIAVVLLTTVARRRPRGRMLRHGRLLAMLALFCVVVAVALFRPYLQARSELGATRKLSEIHKFGARPTDWLAPSHLDRYSAMVPNEWKNPERDLFPGFLLTLGGAAGVAFSLRRRRGGLPATILARSLIASGLLFVVLSHSRAFAFAARLLPGLDGMRVPTRVQLFVLLGLATLAGLGWRALWRFRPSPVWRFAVAASCVALLLPELLVRPLPADALFEPESFDRMPAHVAVVARSNATSVAVFPLAGDAQDLPRVWQALRHGKPVANGFSGYLAPSFRYLRQACRFTKRQVAPRCVDALRELGISHLLIEDSFRELPPADVPRRLEASVRFDSLPRLLLEYVDDEVLFLRVELAREADAEAVEEAE